MDCKTALKTITYAKENSNLIIDTHNSKITMMPKNASIVEMEDNETIYIYDEARDNEYYINVPSIEAISIIR